MSARDGESDIGDHVVAARGEARCCPSPAAGCYTAIRLYGDDDVGAERLVGGAGTAVAGGERRAVLDGGERDQPVIYRSAGDTGLGQERGELRRPLRSEEQRGVELGEQRGGIGRRHPQRGR